MWTKNSGHLKATSIDATASIHGAFVPNSVINFQKDEVWVLALCLLEQGSENEPPNSQNSQKNMDYSIFKALNFNMDGIEATLILYNVICQWSVHMMLKRD